MDRGRSLTSTIPSVGSGTYSPGPNMARSPDEEGSNEECRCHHGPGLPRPQKPCYSVVKCSHFTTCVRGLCHGITSLFLPTDVPGTPLALRHAALCLAKRVYRRGSEATQASAATAQALQRPAAVSWPHPQAPLCRL